MKQKKWEGAVGSGLKVVPGFALSSSVRQMMLKGIVALSRQIFRDGNKTTQAELAKCFPWHIFGLEICSKSKREQSSIDILFYWLIFSFHLLWDSQGLHFQITPTGAANLNSQFSMLLLPHVVYTYTNDSVGRTNAGARRGYRCL